jgi:putative ABC transport system permease protein
MNKMFSGLPQDFRFAIRSLAKDRSFALLAILALGLGIGSATVIFSGVYGVILNTFPFRDADQITSFGIQDLKNPSNGRRESLSMPEFLDYRALNHVFHDISGEYGGFDSRPVRYTTGEETYQFSADYMSANSFAFFGVTPVAGRLATPEDTKLGAPPVFMMSYKLWQQQFNAHPNVVGTSFMLNGVTRTLVGIMPPRFRWGWSEIWIPFAIDRGQVASDPELSNESVWCVGRLKPPGVSLKRAEADLDVIAHQLAKIYPKDYPQQFTVTANRLADRVTGRFNSSIGCSANMFSPPGRAALQHGLCNTGQVASIQLVADYDSTLLARG